MSTTETPAIETPVTETPVTPELLKLFRAPIIKEVGDAEECAKYAREELAKREETLTKVQSLAALDDAALATFVCNDPTMGMLNTLIAAMGGVSNIQDILSPDRMSVGRNLTSLHLSWGTYLKIRLPNNKDVTLIRYLEVAADPEGKITLTSDRYEHFNNIGDAIRRIEEMFDVSFSAVTPRAVTLTQTEVVLPHELGRYQNRISDFLATLDLGITVSVRTKKLSKTRTK